MIRGVRAPTKKRKPKKINIHTHLWIREIMKMYHSIDELHKKAKVLLEKTTEIHRLRYQLQNVDIEQATFGDLPRETVQEVLKMVDDAKAIADDIVNGPVDIRLEKSRA
jgi:hypothetical protein